MMVYCPLFDNFWGDKPRQDYVVQQWTGLKDKKGTDIYEGDVVKHTYYGHRAAGKPSGITTISTVYWSEMSLGFALISNFTMAHTEVLGNIYENPELLNETKPKD